MGRRISKWRARQATCTKKRRYRSEGDALAGISRLLRKRDVTLRAYECPFCSTEKAPGWHLTSSR